MWSFISCLLANIRTLLNSCLYLESDGFNPWKSIIRVLMSCDIVMSHPGIAINRLKSTILCSFAFHLYVLLNAKLLPLFVLLSELNENILWRIFFIVKLCLHCTTPSLLGGQRICQCKLSGVRASPRVFLSCASFAAYSTPDYRLSQPIKFWPFHLLFHFHSRFYFSMYEWYV